jgi:hypothetical protein
LGFGYSGLTLFLGQTPHVSVHFLTQARVVLKLDQIGPHVFAILRPFGFLHRNLFFDFAFDCFLVALYAACRRGRPGRGWRSLLHINLLRRLPGWRLRIKMSLALGIDPFVDLPGLAGGAHCKQKSGC